MSCHYLKHFAVNLLVVSVRGYRNLLSESRNATDTTSLCLVPAKFNAVYCLQELIVSNSILVENLFPNRDVPANRA